MKYKKTAHRLNKILNLRNMKPQDLCNKSGVSKSSISQYINGSHMPSNLSAGKMAKVLNVDPLWLMGFDVDMEKNEVYVANDKDLSVMIEYYNKLNDSGRIKAIERMEELINLGYIRQPDAYVEHADAIRQVRELEEARKRKNNIS